MLKYIEEELGGSTQNSTSAVAGNILIGKVSSRRDFLKTLGISGGLVVGLQLLPAGSALAMKPYPTGAEAMPHKTVSDPLIFVAIDSDGTVTLVAHRSEMGTGTRTSLPMAIADEMEANFDHVRIVQAEGDEPKYGNQDTDGSRSLRHFIQPAREIGASVRLMLEAAAAEKWNVPLAQVRARDHAVRLLDGKGESAQESGQRLGYGELAEAAMANPVPAFSELKFKSEDQFRYIGRGEVPIYDLHDITTGKAIYGADIILEGMKFAVVARPPVVGGTVKSFDSTEAMKVAGVSHIIEIAGSLPPAKFAPLGGIAIVADSTWAAIKGREKLVIEWDSGPHGNFNTSEYEAQMRATAAKPGTVVRSQGDPEATFTNAAKVVTADYYQPHMVHAQMEPVVAVASLSEGKMEIWAPVQSPYGARQDVAKTLGMSEDDVRVNVTLLGGGFGRKSKCDYVIEAALVSKEVGVPIKLQWTREDDIRHGFNATTSVERLEAAVDENNKVVGWRHRSVSPTIFSLFAPDPGIASGVEMGMGLVDTPFDIPNMSIETGEAKAHTRIGWFRSVSNVPHAFAAQSFVAELAHSLGRDPKEMLLELIGPGRKIDPEAANMPKDLWNYGEPYSEFPNDTARLRNVIELAAEKANWGQSLSKGEGLGIAAHRSFVSYVATVVKVRIDENGNIKIPEVYTAIDCGYCINPERVHSQIEGAAVMGTTLAFYSGLHYENGAVKESNFHDYPVARVTSYPERVMTHIVDHPFSVHATGVGEPGIPPFAPALANAIFAASGKRLRDLPFGDKLA
ncbi:xanthine dehydrogenase family protein molybdopterin-binding subunit [Granulosicoccus antarcticus]|uniref:Membrane-bound aldehyde dehydrogenase (Pyrroloquinoline-quinone) n=1 Tax=Granulosicoccus antarcticus IMCC3135 TaxID=1192854 RepID=A0A2Z2NHX4_9GAMM|nr:molybdopterin cofactor-binding domain-containing protein [Granulosicoccus antarcticus]ASJ70906.1 Membrane-bound aldehyde dehydrogenase (pyrroloquinoline-quinone) [Granulosicoccus antarcticus IMCC3135]